MKNEKILITLKLRKRHIVALIALIVGGLLVYAAYFREFMTLPQSATSLLTELPLEVAGKKIMVFSPHCDDETLGAFGMLKRTISDGGDARIVMVTDCNHRFNGKLRKAETVSAMGVAGISANKITFLDFLEGRDQRSDSETKLITSEINQELNDFKPDLVVAPNVADTHQDHKFVAQNVKKVLRDRGESKKAVYYLIHYNFLKYPSPPGLRPNAYLTPPIRLIHSGVSWYKFSLSDDEENLKEEAVFKYKSQLRKTNPVLYRVLLDFVRQNELFMVEND